MAAEPEPSSDTQEARDMAIKAARADVSRARLLRAARGPVLQHLLEAPPVLFDAQTLSLTRNLLRLNGESEPDLAELAQIHDLALELRLARRLTDAGVCDPALSPRVETALDDDRLRQDAAKNLVRAQLRFMQIGGSALLEHPEVRVSDVVEERDKAISAWLRFDHDAVSLFEDGLAVFLTRISHAAAVSRGTVLHLCCGGPDRLLGLALQAAGMERREVVRTVLALLPDADEALPTEAISDEACNAILAELDA